MGHGRELLRARNRETRQDLHVELGLVGDEYRQETGSRLSGGRKDSGWIHNAYEVDLQSGSGKMIGIGTPFTSDWLVDDAGTAARAQRLRTRRKTIRNPLQGWS